jgi:uncharacterized protein YqgC (DUF456 family)
MDSLLWVLAAGLIVLGLLGTVLPVLPGTALVLAGVILGAWVDDFARVSVGAVVLIGVLAVLAWVLEWAAGLLGAQRAGASRQALLGAAIGTVLGLALGLIGVLFMPLLVAAVGEFLARRDQHRALKVGFATWLGLLAGMLAKVVLAFTMVGVFIAALVW